MNTYEELEIIKDTLDKAYEDTKKWDMIEFIYLLLKMMKVIK